MQVFNRVPSKAFLVPDLLGLESDILATCNPSLAAG